MNKKFLGVIAATAVAGAFWACGSGDIFEPSLNERVFLDNPPKGPALCEASGGCDGAFIVETSSSEESSSSRAQGISSSAGGGLSWAKPVSSSSLIISGPTSSSAVQSNPGGVGTCAPISTPIKAGGSVGFRFKVNTDVVKNTNDILNAKYSWNFGTTATPSTGTGISPSGITFTKSGVVNASVEVNIGGQTSMVKCDPLQVNGVDITGCECTTEAPSVDFTSASPSWTVSGCATATATKVITYSWDGGVAGSETSFTKAFTVAQPGWAPTLKVANDDNTVIDVTCPLVKTTEGAEYKIESTTDKVTIPAGSAALFMNLPASWHNGTEGTCTFACQTTGAISGSVDGKALSGSDYVTVSIPIAHTISGYSMPIELSTAAVCSVNW